MNDHISNNLHCPPQKKERRLTFWLRTGKTPDYVLVTRSGYGNLSTPFHVTGRYQQHVLVLRRAT